MAIRRAWHQTPPHVRAEDPTDDAPEADDSSHPSLAEAAIWSEPRSHLPSSLRFGSEPRPYIRGANPLG